MAVSTLAGGSGRSRQLLPDGQLLPEDLQAACKDANVELDLRLQPGYDHSYFNIASFIDEHEVSQKLVN